MTGKNTRNIGAQKEALAESYLTAAGLTVLEKNYKVRQGEIDIICRDGEYLVFVEVKYRKRGSLEDPLSAVDAIKQKRICQTADVYRYRHGIPPQTPVRYDVIGILGEEITWIQNAFPHRYVRG